MSERLSNFRVREETGNRHVGLYRFIERALPLDTPENSHWMKLMLRFAEIQEEMDSIKDSNLQPGVKDKMKVPKKLIAERQKLQEELDPYLREQSRKYRSSVLKDSLAQPRRPHEHGKDSHVFFHGTVDEFLARPKVPRYVKKYSVPGREVGPDNIEYLQKKYQILRKILGDHIPRAWFVFGEFRQGLPKHDLGDFRTSLRAITIQREVRGKTFAQMSTKERMRPEVQKALDEGIKKYLRARKVLRNACEQVGVDPRTFELSLDLGDASPDSAEKKFDPEKYSSPNAMFDENTKRLMFIDMGWGTWSPDKEKVYEYLMKANDV